MGALFACATADSASRAEVAALKAELRSLRADQERLEKRLERAETLAAVATAKKTTAPAPAQEKQPEPSAIPELAVVKLKPKKAPPPAIDTTRPVVEPPQELVEELVAAPSRDVEPESDADDVPAEVADKTFDQAMEALRTGNLSGAAAALERFASDHPKNPRADNALYFSALGYIGLEQHAQAAELLERLVKRYPAGDAVLDALLKLAECRTTLKQKAEAQALYHQVISTYPGTAAADKAQAKLAALSP